MAVAVDQAMVQRRAALDRANEIRILRAAWFRQAKTGEVSAKAVLLDLPDFMESLSVEKLLTKGVPKWGRYRVHRLLVELHLNPLAHLAHLTERQRVALAEKLP